MIEVQITCLCKMIRLPSLGLVLTKGMVTYVDKGKAEVSQDLQNAQRARGIDLKYVERCVERVGETVLASVSTYPNPVEMNAPQPSPVPFFEAPPPEFATSTAAVPKSGDLRGVQFQMNEVHKKMGGLCSKDEMNAIVEKHIGVLGERLGQQIADAVSNIKVAPVVVERAVEIKKEVKKENIPVFIPDNLVKSDMKGDVTVKQSQTESLSVSDAANVLKDMKKKGK